MKTTMQCLVCGAAFTRCHTATKRPQHCSRACANKAPGRMTAEIKGKISKATRAEANPRWKGGTWKAPQDGRVFVRVPDGERHRHPTIRPDGYIKRSQYVWNTNHPDDPVRLGEIIHHHNQDNTDDQIGNLEKMTQSEHARIHFKGRRHTEETKRRMRVAQLKRRRDERQARDKPA